MIRETEVLVYAIGIDSQTDTRAATLTPAASGQGRCSAAAAAARADPVPVSDARRPTPQPPPPHPPTFRRAPRGGNARRGIDERVNVAALRDITDDSGGRTEIIRTARDLDPATAGIADELSKQVLPGLRGHRREGRPLAHDPRRGARIRTIIVRARRGFVATP